MTVSRVKTKKKVVLFRRRRPEQLLTVSRFVRSQPGSSAANVSTLAG